MIYKSPEWAKRSRMRYQRIKNKTVIPCHCWRPTCPRCMRGFHATMGLLDRMIAAGWGDTPRNQIPRSWKRNSGSGTVELVGIIYSTTEW